MGDDNKKKTSNWVNKYKLKKVESTIIQTTMIDRVQGDVPQSREGKNDGAQYPEQIKHKDKT